jgi:polysaccharide export outer membrane protein
MKLISVFLFVVLSLISITEYSSATEYFVGPGDVLNITVYDNDDLKTMVRVGDNGTIIFPLLGQVEVSNLSISQVSDKITQLLADGYLVNPQVNVFVKEFRSKKVVVLGRVRSPGVIELSRPISFLELVSKAGGLEKDAGDTATVKRKENGKDALIVVDLVSLLEGGDLTQNVPILDGDTVVISKSGMCYVTGEVEEPGSYPCGDGSTVLKLIALSNGFTGKAAKSKVRIVRIVNNEKNIYKDVDLDTTVVFDNDVIVVPESFF